MKAERNDPGPLTAAELNELMDLINAARHEKLEVRVRVLLERYSESGFLWKLLSEALKMQGKEALQALRSATRLLPEDAAVHTELGNALQKRGQFEDALSSYRQALAIKPDDANVHNNVGSAWRAMGQLDRAVASYREALQISPAFAIAHSNLGNALVDLGRLDEAVSCHRRALELKPEFAGAHNNLGNALQSLGRSDQAVDCFRRALRLRPDFAQAHHNLGNALHDLGRIDDALASYRCALQINHDYVEAHNNLGNALQSLGRPDEAVDCFRRALQLRPDFAQAHNNLGNALRDLGRFDDALISYRRALQIKPDFAEAHNNIGNTLCDLGQLDDAVASFRRGLALKPDYPALHSNLGNALFGLGQLDDALASYRRALEFKGDCAEAYNNIGNVLRDLGQPDSAIASYRHALAIRPSYAEAYNNLGNILRDLGQLDTAIAYYQQALAIRPEFAEAHNSLSIALKLLGRMAEAEASCRRALAIAPNRATTMMLLADFHADRGQFAEAEALFRRVLSISPELPEAWAGIARWRKMTSRDADWLARVQRIAEKRLPPSKEIFLRYALGKYFDDMREFEPAFDHFRRANELAKRYGAKYDRHQLVEAVDRTISLYDHTRVRRAIGDAVASSRPVFIVGMPRSGTTLTEQILASHPGVFGAGELPFWEVASAIHEDRASNDAERQSKLRRLAEEYLQFLMRLSSEALRVVDKMPGNFMFLGLIHQALPNARIIHMRRDPIDTCLSSYFQHFQTARSYANDLGDLAHYYVEYRRIMEHWRAVLPGDCLLDVPYEGLIDDPEIWSRRMLEFIGLPWDPLCLEFHRTERAIITASKWQVRQKISKASVARWRNYEKYIGPLMELRSFV